jgi:hypothetical protein
VFLVNSRHPHFSATPFGSKSKFFHLVEAHLFPKLRCQFAEFLDQSSLERLRILTLPTCVGLRYDHRIDSLEAFLGSMGSTSLYPKRVPHHFSVLNERTDLPILSTYQLESGHPSPEWPTLLRPPITQTPIWWYRNINLFPITYAFRPRLRGRLTLRRLTLLRKPWAYGERVSHPLYRYSCQHDHFHSVHQSLRSGFNPEWNAPLPSFTHSAKGRAHGEKT